MRKFTLAKEAVNLTTLATNKICLDDLIAADKVVQSRKWSERWKNYCRNNPIRYTRIHPDIPSKHWHYDLNLSRRSISVYNKLKFGHGCYPAFLAKIGITNSNLCEGCNLEVRDHLASSLDGQLHFFLSDIESVMSSRGGKLVALARAQAIESSEEEFEEDSVKEKDYVPSSDEDEEDLEIVILMTLRN
ncbi:hypothetical protein JTB14_036419 [Gonioctena quinquepunctata]|nr:hypothetical protein JTB14_036419 [Gonioctena quinquepunctata]